MLLRLVETSDALIEGHRPGTMERLAIGPDVCLARRPQLVYARMTGWGQDGPLAQAAVHDLNYIALSGALYAVGPAEAPVPPLNLVDDYGGGGMMLAFGIVSALLEARRSGQGQVVDAAMCDGAALLMASFYAMVASGRWQDRRASNAIDGGVPWYGVYRCADGGFVSVAALEPAFFERLVELLGLPHEAHAERADPRTVAAPARTSCRALREPSARRVVRPAGRYGCLLAPVLGIAGAHSHAHLRARATIVEVGGRASDGTRAALQPHAQRVAGHGGSRARARRPARGRCG